MSIAVDAGKPLPETERLVVGGPAFTESVTAGWGEETPPPQPRSRKRKGWWSAARPSPRASRRVGRSTLRPATPRRGTCRRFVRPISSSIFREDREGLTGRSLWSADSRFTQHGLRLLPRLAMEGQHTLVVNRTPKGHRPSGCLTGMLPIARRARNRSQ